jgi:hypothetical protein
MYDTRRSTIDTNQVMSKFMDQPNRIIQNQDGDCSRKQHLMLIPQSQTAFLEVHHYSINSILLHKHDPIQKNKFKFKVFLKRILRNMLSDDFREKLRRKFAQEPIEAVKEIEKNPEILKLLLDSHEDKIKYIKMNDELQARLQKQSKKLNVTQGWLIGAGLLLFLSLLDDR